MIPYANLQTNVSPFCLHFDFCKMIKYIKALTFLLTNKS